MGWKSDNGFRGGYLQRLEEAIAAAFPGTDLKATPHINSKLQTWKKNYYSLSLMLGRSGVGFNVNGTYTINCNQEQWEQIVKCDGNAKTMCYKSWPMYDDWTEIFDKDRANGESAEDIMDAVNELNRMESQGDDIPPPDFDYHPSLEDILATDEVGKTSIYTGSNGGVLNKNKIKGKKRGADDSVVLMGELIQEISGSTNARLDQIATRIGYEFDVDEAKNDAFTQLEKIPGLSLDEKFDVCEIFADKTERLLIFKGLPESARPQYVQRLLKAKHDTSA